MHSATVTTGPIFLPPQQPQQPQPHDAHQNTQNSNTSSFETSQLQHDPGLPNPSHAAQLPPRLPAATAAAAAAAAAAPPMPRAYAATASTTTSAYLDASAMMYTDTDIHDSSLASAHLHGDFHSELDSDSDSADDPGGGAGPSGGTRRDFVVLLNRDYPVRQSHVTPPYDNGNRRNSDSSSGSSDENAALLGGSRGGNGGFPSAKGMAATAAPLFQPLLPHAPDDPHAPPLLYIDPERRRFRDLPIILFYASSLLFMLAWGVVAATSATTSPIDGSPSSYIYHTLFYTFTQSATTIALLTALSVVAGAAWLALLSSFARPIIIITAITIPSSILVVSIISFFACLSATFAPKVPDTLPEIRAVLVVSVAGVVAAIWLALYIWRKRAMIDTMTHIIELSCDILQLNPSLFVLSVGLMIAHAVFSVMWFYLFSRLFLIGSLMPSDPTPSTGTTWTFVPSSETPLIAIFFILMYFWTSAIFQNLEKTTIASVVGGWYFQDVPESPMQSSDQTWRHFKNVATRSFGTVACASLVLGAVRTLQFVITQIKTRASRGRSGFARFMLTIVTSVSMMIEDFSHFALVHAGLRGTSFTESAYACTRLFRRNLVFGLMTQGMTRVIGVLGKVLVSSVVGLVVFWGSVSRVSSDGVVGTGGHEWIAAGVATLVPYYVVGVLTHVIENTVDATFICYLIDLDTNSCHCEGAHKIFAESLS